MITLILEDSNEAGYVIKDQLKEMFVNEYYKDQESLANYCKRYGVKSLLAKSRMKNQFHTLIELLKKKGVVKEYYKNTGLEIYWNYVINIFND
ncbi:hypothetical protein [Peribacillus kribbensis]|uniref:hypothetical protein n=1 Tax=Peribacillus kribbensis TaxID=356658 RepID=UPI00047E4485|nr:hypothetical protein [Peribacillus kribbensis]